MHKRMVSRLAGLVLALMPGFVHARDAHAQEVSAPTTSEAVDTLRRAVLTPDVALVPLPAELICGPTVQRLSVSPQRNMALIVRSGIYPARTVDEFIQRNDRPDAAAQVLDTNPSELQLLLWRTTSRHTTTLWHWTQGVATGHAQIVSVSWLPGTDTALVQIATTPGPLQPEQVQKMGRADGPKTKTIVLRVNGVSGVVDTIAFADGGSNQLYTSPEVPFGALVSGDGRSIIRIGATGAISAPVIIPNESQKPEEIYWAGWLPGREVLLGVRHSLIKREKNTRYHST